MKKTNDTETDGRILLENGSKIEVRSSWRPKPRLAIGIRLLDWLSGVTGVRVPYDVDRPIMSGIISGLTISGAIGAIQAIVHCLG
jgi:hypothetical protein